MFTTAPLTIQLFENYFARWFGLVNDIFNTINNYGIWTINFLLSNKFMDSELSLISFVDI